MFSYIWWCFEDARIHRWYHMDNPDYMDAVHTRGPKALRAEREAEQARACRIGALGTALETFLWLCVLLP